MLRAFFTVILAMAVALPVSAQDKGWDSEVTEVDVELVLAVDVSRSMSPRELEIQRRGYAEAILTEPVLHAITGGFTGHVAVTYVEWAGTGSHRVVVDWMRIATRADAEAFAAALTSEMSSSLRRTSISGALEFAASRFDRNGFQGLRRVIDISGDGPNNQGGPVTEARDRVVSKGITINGLPLMTNDGFGGQYTLSDLDEYYRNCVIGGPTAFIVPVTDWEQFADAVRQKLVLELVGLPPPATFAAPVTQVAGFDCLVGEKIWRRNQRNWSLP